MKPCDTQDTGTCQRISEMLSRIGDKWTLLIVRELGQGPLRFSALKRRLGSISQKMLTATLRNLERDGMVSRTVTPATPPQVEYALTAMGHDLFRPIAALAEWTITHADAIDAARQAYDGQRAA
ncbi:winged helix-turn-helix transcriptional regulator [Paracoccus sphaerophysae]|uniref:HxlR family transcriptional regulator n=1 Tax=Paracoccus sphaerophysae TaxID=690417 RepID=A0A099FAR0_9RHOB|nr:helix-turn-helix domain-containing protein [Paracoccus sphaerophysae]KGJ07619.1 HxlR family transcriptional regulator [Paracoccus sphaerophysae]